MNSIEMTSNIPTKPDGQSTLPTLPKDAPIREEFSFSSSNRTKITNHLSKFRWFGAAIILLVTIVTFSTIIHTSKLKEKSTQRAAALSQIQGKESGLVLNGKVEEMTTMLWSREDSESSDDDDDEEVEVNNGTTTIKKAGKVTTETRKLEVNGSIFKDAWRAMRTKTSKFVVLRQNIWNPRLVDAKLGQWSRTFIDFKTEIPATEPAIGFIYLGNTGQERYYEVVYIPSDMDVQPADIVSKYGLPSDPNELAKVSGCPVANTIVIRNFRELNALNIMKNAKAGAVVSLWSNEDESSDDDDEEEVDEVVASSEVLAADGANYASVWSAMKSKLNRFVVFRKNANKVEAKLGGWNSLVSEFQAQFPANDEAVGFMILGSGNYEELYEVVYVPASKTTKPSQVLANFGLPSNPALLRSNGLKVANTLVVKNYKDINTNNLILNAKPSGIVSAWEEEGLVSMWWGDSEESNDGSTYSEVWNTLKQKTKRFVIFRKNAENPQLVDVTYGDWNTTSADFASAFKVNKAQVGYAYLGTKNHEKLYEVVYAPTILRTNPASILVSFGLPPNPSNLAQYGLEVPSTFVTTDKKQIDTGNIIMKAVNAGIISAWSSESSDDEEEEIVDYTAVLAADGAAYASVWNTMKAKANRFVVFRKNANKIEAKIGSWNALVPDFQAQFPVDQEAVGFIILGSGAYEQLYEVVFIPSGKSLTAPQVLASFNLPTNPALLKSGLQVADTLVIRNYKDITSTNLMLNSKKAGIISLWDESSRVLAADGANYATLWNELKAKTKRFVVFRRSATNPKQIEVKIGAWDSLVSQFQAQFPADQEAVGFMILGSDTSAQLYEVVYVPSTRSISPAQVLANFGLPANPALLNSNGLQVANTIVVRNYNDINTMNMVLNSKQSGVISLWDRVLAADGSNYAPVWNTIKSKTSRFVVFRKNPTNPKQIEAKIGSWNAIVSDFQAQFIAGQEAVGFIILGGGAYEQLFEVVYVPSDKLTASQVLASFNLPNNPALLKSGLPQTADTIVIKNYNEITSTNIMLNSKKAGIVSAWAKEQEEEENDSDSTDDGESETEGGIEIQQLWWSSSTDSNDGSTYSEVWNTLKQKTKKFVVFRKNAENPQLVDVTYGDWNTTSADFASTFKVNKAQVGYAYLGTKNHEKLYEVVYAPVALRTNPATILVSFGLPPNPSNLAQFGIEVPATFVTTDKKQIDTGNIIQKATPAGIVSL